MINEQFLELAKKLPKEVTEKAVALVEKMGEEIEGIGDEPITWRPNFLRLIQATSDRSKLPKGTAPGALVLGEEVLEQPVSVIPLRVWNSRQYWDPDHDANRQLCFSPDAIVGLKGNCRGCPHALFNEEMRKSDCGVVKNFLVITEDLSDIFFIQFAKTNYSNGKDWEGVLKKAGVAPYRRVYNLETFTNPSYKNVESVGAKPKGETPAKYNDFLEALMRQFGEDRKEYIAEFRKMAEERRQAAEAQQEQLGHDSSDVALEHIPEEESTASSSEATDSGAKSYSL